MCVVLCKRKMVRICIFFSSIIKDRKWKQKNKKKKTFALIFYLIEFEVDWPERPYNHPRRLCQRGRCRPALSTFRVFVSSFACLQHACLTEWKTSTTDFALQAGRQASWSTCSSTALTTAGRNVYQPSELISSCWTIRPCGAHASAQAPCNETAWINSKEKSLSTAEKHVYHS